MQTGGAQPHIHPSDLNPVEVSIPKHEIQIRIATTLSDMDSEITTLETRLTKAKSIKQGMMQQLLTGKIRLILTKNIKINTGSPRRVRRGGIMVGLGPILSRFVPPNGSIISAKSSRAASSNYHTSGCWPMYCGTKFLTTPIMSN